MSNCTSEIKSTYEYKGNLYDITATPLSEESLLGAFVDISCDGVVKASYLHTTSINNVLTTAQHYVREYIDHE